MDHEQSELNVQKKAPRLSILGANRGSQSQRKSYPNIAKHALQVGALTPS